MQVEHQLMELYEDKFQINSNDELISEQEQMQYAEKSNISNTVNKQSKIRMPKIFHKAKRTITKLVNQFFTELKDQIMRGTGQIKMFQQQLDNIVKSLHQFIRIGCCGGIKTINFQGPINRLSDSSVYSFVSQSKKILQFSKEGKITQIQLFLNSPHQKRRSRQNNSQQKQEIKLPDGGTPIPFGQNIFILDGSEFHSQRKVYIPCSQFFKIKKNGEVSTISPLRIYPPVDYNYEWSFSEFPLHRIKCSLVKDQKFIYMLGGYVQQFKVLTKHCQKLDPNNNIIYTLPKLNFTHKCPSSTIVNRKIWLFSQNDIEFLDLDILDQYEKKASLKPVFPHWKVVEKPFGAIFSPFQFIYNLNDSGQLLIFGGMKNNRKLKNVSLYNVKTQQFQHCGDLLPQGVCNSRTWGPTVIKQHLTFFSQIQAAIYPQVGIKSECSQLIFMGSNGSCYLQSFVQA